MSFESRLNVYYIYESIFLLKHYIYASVDSRVEECYVLTGGDVIWPATEKTILLHTEVIEKTLKTIEDTY